jgi:peroxiredoxin
VSDPSDLAPSLGDTLREIKARAPDAVRDRLNGAIEHLAAEGVAPGLEIGERAPMFSLPDQNGNHTRLADVLDRGPAVVVFYRGEWCPYCNVTLRAFQQQLPAMQALGATLLAISPQAPDRALILKQRHQLEYAVLSDVDQRVISSFRLQYTVPQDVQELSLTTFHNDLREQNADGSWNVPVPATFVIDSHGTVQARHVDIDYRLRMEPLDVVRALRELVEVVSQRPPTMSL